MGEIKKRIEADLKSAMLSRDTVTADALRGIKSSILNEEVAQGQREEGLSDQDTENLLTKEVKKRKEAAELYNQGGNHVSAEKEAAEASIIQKYLPEQMSEADIKALVDGTIAELGAKSKQDAGKVIGAVKQKTGNSADGALIAKLVNDKLS